MVTSGMDSRLKVWDVRNFKMLHSYFTRRPAVSLDISQRGLVGMGKGREVEVWKGALVEKQRAPYMTHRVAGEVSRVRFCPFEDCLGIGHGNGFTSIIVPGIEHVASLIPGSPCEPRNMLSCQSESLYDGLLVCRAMQVFGSRVHNVDPHFRLLLV